MSQSKSVFSENKFFEFFQKSWIMLLFWAFCFAVYSHGMRKKTKTCMELQYKIVELEQVKQSFLEEQEDLSLQIHSQNDPAWVELVLKKKLGVVPEGQIKVYFKKDE